ncbi:Uncharacterized protein PECH_004160 [Penicillium ucsense]|uniref:DNA-binding protein RAP1 n=1 Tax=Penicillium ucsense TaxID=2839758 RepID=A0A8J8W8E1_9EURO|nr:Uncharacterized protein PECM_005567 [Penicillium ucsense]KAF7737243.1 Uncharacterized protein PECH_004160 [Penicillium ucsense]
MPNLFGGARFFLSHAVPQRSQLRVTIEQNGGTVVLLEKDADTILVDHLKKSQTHPANALSYQFVERSVRNGKLEDPELHKVGPSPARPLGASNIPTKSTKRSYSLEDDRIVFDWLYPLEQTPGAPTHGTSIYKLLAERFPHHTWQSWRSRYLKTLRGKPRPGGGEPRPDLVYGGPEAVPGCKKPGTAPQRPQAGSLATGRSPAAATSKELGKSASRPVNNQSGSKPPTKPEVSARKREPPLTSSPEPSVAAKKARKGADKATLSSAVAVQSPPAHPPLEAKELATTASNEEVHTEGAQPPNGVQETLPLENVPTLDQSSKRSAEDQVEEHADPLFQHLPFFPTSSDSGSDNSGSEDADDDSDPEEYPDLRSWVNAQVAKGVDGPTVLNALRYTSMEPGPAKKLLQILVDGNPVPQNMRGVWTEEDDRCLQSRDAHDVERVVMKHGDRLFKARWEYLEMARERGLVD